MLRALTEYRIEPLTTLIPFHAALLATDQWANGETCRDLTEDKKWLKTTQPDASPAGSGEEQEPEEQTEREYKVEVDGRLHSVRVIGAAAPAPGPAPGGAKRPPKRERKASAGAAASSEALVSPLQGTVLKVAVEEGAEVEEGALICVIEAMKMENEITAHRAGKVTSLAIKEGAAVAAGDLLAKIE
jgi:acetyl-CoA/propionyl-CoA carboxylase biotin carboxyl carrier protein